MTRLGAIIVLTQIKKAHETMPKFIKRLNEKMAEERIEALDIAIKNLSAEPSGETTETKVYDSNGEVFATFTRPSGDLISRADTLAKIKEYCIDGDAVVQNWFDTMGIEEVINTMPSVSADRPQGEDWDKYSEKLWKSAYECRKAEALIQSEPMPFGMLKAKAKEKADAAPVVAYICDRRRCAICRGKDGGCDHTTDIKHAAHFKNVAGQYFERPYMEEEEDDE